MRIKNILLAVLAIIAASSCSHIDEDERYIYIKPAEATRNILIEDFTGQRCVNCPNATEEIAKYQETFGENTVIAVAIHSGPFGHQNASESSQRYPLCTETGDSYFKYWTGSWTTAQPCVIVNRNGNKLSLPPYGESILSALEQTTPVTLNLSTACNSDTTEVTVTVDAITSENVNTMLQVWVLEDSITGTQYMPDGSRNTQYMHNHVFRTSVTDDIYGDAFNITEGANPTTVYKFAVDEKWKARHLSVVAFVYNTADGVIQAVRKPLVEKETDENN